MICNQCLKDKDNSEFHKDKYRNTGFVKKCKQCSQLSSNKNKIEDIKHRLNINNNQCTNCHTFLTLENINFQDYKRSDCDILCYNCYYQIGYDCWNPEIKTALKFLRLEKSTKAGRMALYKCECGIEKICKIKKVQNGSIKSCGCKRYNFARKEYGEGAFNALYRAYRHEGQHMNRSFELTKEQFKDLTKQNCYYCNSPPSKIFGSTYYRKTYGDYVYNGIDRIDSNKSYTIDNVVTCCEKCNRMKWILSQEEFLYHISKIYKYKVA